MFNARPQTPVLTSHRMPALTRLAMMRRAPSSVRYFEEVFHALNGHSGCRVTDNLIDH
jgi:hypothetical protein